MQQTVPETMSTLILNRHDTDLRQAIRGLSRGQRPVPRPRHGQVLVRIEAAPCNPSDLLFLQGLYGVDKTLPAVPGWEGAGTVVAAGGGWLARRLVGKRVACGGQTDTDGTWAEYYLAEARACVPLQRGIDLEQGASLIINPLTALGLFDLARKARVPAVLQTAGASQVGRMLVRLAADAGLPLLSIVRRDEQVELLRSMGAEHLLNSESERFEEQLRRICAELRITMAFEAVAGEMTGRLFNAMPAGARVVVYGALSESPCAAIDPIGLIFRGKRVEGFYLGDWIREQGLLGALRASSKVQKLIRSGAFSTAIQRRVGLEDAVEGLLQYHEHMTDGKVLILPGKKPGTPAG